MNEDTNEILSKAEGPNGSAKVTIEVGSDQSRNLETLIRRWRILGEVSDLNIARHNGSIKAELYVSERPVVEPPPKAEQKLASEAHIKVDVQKLHIRSYRINLTGKRNGITNDRLDELAETAKLLGDTSEVADTFSADGLLRKVSFVMNTDKYGSNFITSIIKMVEDIRFFHAFQGVQRDLYLETDKYLGTWKRGSYNLRAIVAQDMKRMYGVIKENYIMETGKKKYRKITMEDVASSNKGKGLAGLRAAIAYYLQFNDEYKLISKKGLSSEDIAAILGGKNHATVLLGIKKFKDECVKSGYEMSQKDLSDFEHYFKKFFEVYPSRKPERHDPAKISNV